MIRRVLFLLLAGLTVAGLVAAQQDAGDRQSSLEERVQALEAAQEGVPGHTFLLTGYMNALYTNPEEGDPFFSTLFAPIFLYKSGDRFLFEAELEFEFEGENTEVQVEYSQLDYMFDGATLVAGKFLLPMGIFGERVHPAWINKLPIPPPIYAGHGSSVGLIPVMSDFGVMLRGGFPAAGLRWNWAAFVVNGPRVATEEGGDEHAEEEAGGHGGGGAVNYAGTPGDENADKALGFRVGVLPFSGLEIGLSYYRGEVSFDEFEGATTEPGPESEAIVTLTMVDVMWSVGALQIIGEYILEDTSELKEFVVGHTEDDPDTLMDDETATEEGHAPDDRSGYWLQAAYMLSGIFPEVVVRYGATQSEGEQVSTQSSIGLNWWIESSLVVKLAGVSNSIEVEDHDTGATETVDTTDYYVALAFGF